VVQRTRYATFTDGLSSSWRRPNAAAETLTPCRLKTAEGNNDWVFNNIPVFFVRDPIKFPSLNRSHKRNPATNASDADMFWDFHVNNPEGIHALMFLFGDRGQPASLRHINGYSGHTYIWKKRDGDFHYVKIHIHSDIGTKFMAGDVANRLAGVEPDHHTLDLFNSIAEGRYPTYTVSIQTIAPAKLADCPVNIFDMTKTWPKSLYPLRPVGRITLDRNPRNYFAEIEQAAFSPSNMVPGIEPSADPMLQARMFAYPDAARYRLGANYQQLPTNACKALGYTPTQRDGFMTFSSNYGDDPNYIGSSIKPTKFRKDVMPAYRQTPEPVTGPVVFSSEMTDADYEQARAMWEKVLAKKDGAQDRFIDNLAAHVAQVKRPWLRGEVFKLFSRVNDVLGIRLKEAVENFIKQ
jgi:catalase